MFGLQTFPSRWLCRPPASAGAFGLHRLCPDEGTSEPEGGSAKRRGIVVPFLEAFDLVTERPGIEIGELLGTAGKVRIRQTGCPVFLLFSFKPDLFECLQGEVEAEGSESPSACNALRLLLLTGCRLREIQTLQWNFVKYDYIHLPDSKTGARKIPIDEPVRNVLADIPQFPNNLYVITGKLPGSHLTDLQRPWRRIRAKAGLSDVRIHDLRHTFASMAIANGLSLELAGKLLGHTQLQTTARYAHLADAHVRDAAAIVSGALNGLLANPKPPTPAQRDGSNVVRFPKVTA